MLAKSSFRNDTLRPVAIAAISAILGSTVVWILELLIHLEVSKIATSVVTFVIAAFFGFIVFPKRLKMPFGEVSLSEFLHRLGFYLPTGAWKHVLLGIALAACTIAGMLIGSLVSGRYQLDWSNVNVAQTVFSVNPGIWEEFFHRGVIMFLLIKATNSLKRAALFQIVLFGLLHVKGFDLWAWVDVISVMIIAVAFTYAAYKTRTLVAGIVFHFIHDALLFLPQLPGGEYVGASENVPFFVSLWVMVGVGCLLIKFSSDELGVKADQELYVLGPTASR